jgi:hypothetical protein
MVVRRRVEPRSRPNNVLCPECRQRCTWLGTTISVPPQSKPKKWIELQALLLKARDRRQLLAARQLARNANKGT